MTDGTETLDQTGSDTTTGDGGQTEGLDTELDTSEAESAESEQEAVEELEDIEFGGKKYKLPKEIAPALMMQADYTRKTQEVAEHRKALEADRQVLAQQAEAAQAHLDTVAQRYAVDQAVKQFERIDWRQFEADDPIRAQSAFREMTMLKGQRDELTNKIVQAEQKRGFEAQQDFAKRYGETNATLAKDIKNWSEVAPKLGTYARENGVSAEDMRALAVHAPAQKILHKAYLYDQLVSKQRAAAAAKAAAETPPAEPLKQVAKGRSSPANGGLSDNLSAEEWAKRRDAQVAAQNLNSRARL